MAAQRVTDGREVDVIVVGAGPVGLALAIGLTRQSLKVRLVDKAAETKREARAAVIWPRAREVLADFDVEDAFEQAANKLRSVAVYADGDRLGELELGRLVTAYPFPLVIEQDATERLLAGRLGELGVRVEWCTEVRKVRLFDDRAEVTLRRADGSTETAVSGWVVGCEGSRSVVRESLGIPFEGERRENLQVVQIDATPHWRYHASSERGYFFLAANASLGCFPVPEGGWRFFAFTNDPGPAQKEPPTLGQMRELVASVARAPELELSEPRWFNRARFQDRIAGTLRRGRALLAGDAAHVWAPIGGHGMNVGLQDAHNLAWKLAAVHRGEARESLLGTYSEEQREMARAVIREMRLNVLERPNPPVLVSALKVLMPLGLSLDAVQGRIEFALSDLGMHRRKSQLSRQGTPAGPLRAGDRAPNVAVVADGGRRTDLHRLLSYGHWTLLLRPGRGYSKAAGTAREAVASLKAPVRAASVTPANANARRALGRREGLLMLVRPDGYVGLAARMDDVNALEGYLDRFFRSVAP
jgi:2-polyprenyl-6-methoxyphenol hydroxylase-like FAD-dependent oxidoreductase